MNQVANTQDDHDASVAETIIVASACWALLRSAEVGRLAVVVEGQPEIFPINYVVDHGTIVFRSATGTKLAGALSGVPVAFEVDGSDAGDHEAWSVVVKGLPSEIRRLDDVMDSADLPLAPWHAAPKDRFVRIVPTQVSGRRFAVQPASTWATRFTLAHRSSPE